MTAEPTMNKTKAPTLIAHGLLLQVRSAPTDADALRHIDDAFDIVTAVVREELLAVLEGIATDLESVRRVGGPAPEDLAEIDDALCGAVNAAVAAVESIRAQAAQQGEAKP